MKYYSQQHQARDQMRIARKNINRLFKITFIILVIYITCLVVAFNAA